MYPPRKLLANWKIFFFYINAIKNYGFKIFSCGALIVDFQQ